jgi:MFS family permease
MTAHPTGTGERHESLWRHGDFVKLWTAQTLSLVGSQVTLLAMPLTAVVVLSASPFEVGVLTALGYLPFLVVGLPAGVWVDRLRRRPVLITADLGRAVILCLIPVLYAMDGLTMSALYPVAFLAGVLTVFFDVAHQAYLPSLISRSQLVEGNAKLEMSYSGAQLGGPALGGGLVQVLTAPVALLVDALSYLASAVSLLLIRRPEPPPAPPDEDEGGLFRQIRTGLRYVLTHKLLGPIAVSTGVGNLFDLFGMVAAVLVLFSVRELGMSPAELGIALAVANVGALLGALLSGRIARRLGIGWSIALSATLVGPAVLLLPLATPGTAIAVLSVALGIAGFAISVFNINQISLRQAVTPDRMQGRMNATMRFLIWGTLPIGGLLGGLLGGTIGLRPTLVIAGIGSLLASLPLFVPAIRALREVGEEDGENEGTA